MQIQENIPLAPLTTLRVGGAAQFFARATTEADVQFAVTWARERQLPLFVLGGGSNLVISDDGYRGLVLQPALMGIRHRHERSHVIFEPAAGEEWDKFVAMAVEHNCAGIECLSGIPGSVAGTPVQNVGAYGQEVSESITSVRALDLATNEITELSREDCGFAYRTSIFNSSQSGRYIVLRVSFALTHGARPRIEYADLKKYFASHHSPTLAETRAAVREIRRSKAMLLVDGDPDVRSAGSFFKNPIVSEEQYAQISSRPAAAGKSVPKFSAPNGQAKVSAAWLVENSGFQKGFTRGPVGISSKHALALVNRGGAKAADIISFKDEIQRRVQDSFRILLQPEPVFVGFEKR